MMMNPFTRRSWGCLWCAILLLFCGTFASAQQARTITDLDNAWKFHLGDTENAQQTDFDDTAWRQLDVPHDWSIEGDYDITNPTRRGGGYLPAGVGWYRKTFTVPASDVGKRVAVHFDGIMANSDVWINGHHLGHRPFGYLPVIYDLTDHLNFGSENVIAVRCDNTVQPASRWYTGAGIYRHVALEVTDPVHLKRWSVYITTPEITPARATVSVQAAVQNESDRMRQVTVQTTLTSPAGKSVKTDPVTLSVAPRQTAPLHQTVSVPDPELWDITDPNLYTAVTTVTVDGRVIDDEKNTFGIRECHFESETGFWLNGRNVRIYGACLHHDGGAVGAAVPLSVWERRLELLKQVGCNAVRGAHNPMDKPFYDLLDRMGILFLDETFDTWTYGKNHGQKAYNLYFNEWWYEDARDQILRVRNHPSIIMWSLGNEIRDNVNSPEGRQRFLNLLHLTRELDPTRPITMALFRPGQMGLYENGFADMLGVIGQNYGESLLMAAWKGKPGRKIIGTENTPSREAWVAMRDHPMYAGQFIWTGFDYLGEADWPQISWNTGLFDRNGGWKALGWQRQSWWTSEPMVHMVRRETHNGKGILVSDWTPQGIGYDTAHLEVYSNCEAVELFLNNRSLGVQPMPKDASPARYAVAYQPGTLKAVGRNAGAPAAQHELVTASRPVRLELTAEKTEAVNDWDEVVYLKATLVDRNGVRYPNSSLKVRFTLSGPGEIVSVDNSDVYNHERYKTDTQSLYQGEAIAIIRATDSSGTITVTASAEGVKDSSVTLRATHK